MSSVAAVSAQNDALLHGAKGDVICGGWTPIKNVDDPHVQELGRFAVMEHNKETGEHVTFLCVVSGMTQVVAGINYRLVIKAKGNNENMIPLYEAMVWDKTWEHTWTLVYFKPLLQV